MSMNRFSFLWSEDLAARTRQFAAFTGLSVTDVIRWALSEKLVDDGIPLQSASNEELVDEVRRRQRPPNHLAP